MAKKYMKKKNMMYSVLAVLLVVLLVPAALGVVGSMNDAYSQEYVTVLDVNELNPECPIYGWAYTQYPVTLYGENSTGDSVVVDETGGMFFDANGSVDTLFIDFAGTAVSASSIMFNVNHTIRSLYDNGTSRLYLHYDTSNVNAENLTLIMRLVGWDDSGTSVYNVVVSSETVGLVNHSYDGYVAIDSADMLYAMSELSGHDHYEILLQVQYDDGATSFADGEQIDFRFVFEKQRGVSESALTPYVVGTLGVVLLVSAAASTDIIDPTSPYHVINNPFKKKRAPRRRKTASRRRKTTRKRRR